MRMNVDFFRQFEEFFVTLPRFFAQIQQKCIKNEAFFTPYAPWRDTDFCIVHPGRTTQC